MNEEGNIKERTKRDEDREIMGVDAYWEECTRFKTPTEVKDYEQRRKDLVQRYSSEVHQHLFWSNSLTDLILEGNINDEVFQKIVQEEKEKDKSNPNNLKVKDNLGIPLSIKEQEKMMRNPKFRGNYNADFIETGMKEKEDRKDEIASSSVPEVDSPQNK